MSDIIKKLGATSIFYYDFKILSFKPFETVCERLKQPLLLHGNLRYPTSFHDRTHAEVLEEHDNSES